MRTLDDVTERDWLAARFEEHRPRLRRVAYRMLGTLDETEDAVQEAWLRLSRSDESAVENLEAWLTTVVGRICLDMLRSRRARREDLVGSWLPEPVVTGWDGATPEDDVLAADAVGLALLVVLEALSPAERLAFVLHDMFAVPFDEIAPIVGRSPAATRQLASRGRRRVRGSQPESEADPEEQRAVADAFLAATRAGDFDALVAVLDPDVEFRIDFGPGSPIARTEPRGAEEIARQALAGSRRIAPRAVPVRVNGAAGAVVPVNGRAFAVVAFTVSGGRVTAIDLVLDRRKLRRVSVPR